MQTVELFENKYPTDESRRTQHAAKCLVWLLGKLGKDCDPRYVKVAEDKNPLVVDVMLERELRRQLEAVNTESQDKLDALLLDPSDEGKLLREWHRIDARALLDYSVDPMLLVRKLKRDAVNGMIPLHHVAGTCTNFTTTRTERGYISRPDPESFTHDLMVRIDALEVRTHVTAGGEVKFLTYVTEYRDDDGVHSVTYDIIRSDAERLLVGDPKKTNHLPSWHRPAPKLEE